MAKPMHIDGKPSQPEQHLGGGNEVSTLMTLVGERVRKAREQKGMVRRVLSETSGVSPRYLAQLESGKGNISIGLLKRVSIALDRPIAWFVREDDPKTGEAMRVADQFSAADSTTQTRVQQILNLVPMDRRRSKRICLIGLRGAGKSTLGKAAGAFLKMPFVELNKEIERQAGMPIAEIMALYGQEGYRKLESDAVDQIESSHEKMILAVAGGIVAEPKTYRNLLRRFHTIWIKASPQEHMDRVRAQGDERPMAGNPEAMAQLLSILTSREALYCQAEAVLDTSGTTPDVALDELLTIVNERGFLD
jgi:XRE family aerobic/anaerobic benzoate catabolism transcriptional regulator